MKKLKEIYNKICIALKRQYIFRLAVCLKQYNCVKTQLEEQKLITESWREFWRIKKVQLDANERFRLNIMSIDCKNQTNEELIKIIDEIHEIFKSDCKIVGQMWKDEERREKLSHAFKIFAKEE